MTTVAEIAAAWDGRMRAAVPDALRVAAQRELRNRDRFPRDAIGEQPGVACRAALVAVRDALTHIDEEQRRAFADWLAIFPGAPGAASLPAEQAAPYALAHVLTRAFYEPRVVLDADAARRGEAFDVVAGLADAHDDKDGLVPLAFFDDPTPYDLRKGAAYLHYHPFLRRYLAAHVNVDFTSRLVRAADDRQLRVQVAVDPDRVTDRPLMRFVERDYWWGPPLTLERVDDVAALGVTVHGRADGLATYWEWPLVETEFEWTGAGDGHKALKIEELSPGPGDDRRFSLPHNAGMAPSSTPVLNRYLHAIRDTRSGCFVHLDGAVRAYEPDEYTTRRSQRIDRAGKAGRYRKVFRIDGRMSDEDWCQLAVMFFRQNEMVAEYLHEGFQQTIAEKSSWPDAIRKKLPGRPRRR